MGDESPGRCLWLGEAGRAPGMGVWGEGFLHQSSVPHFGDSLLGDSEQINSRHLITIITCYVFSRICQGLSLQVEKIDRD